MKIRKSEGLTRGGEGTVEKDEEVVMKGKCAKIVEYSDTVLARRMSGAVWCGKPATHATVAGKSPTPLSIADVGHFYCEEHAPASAVRLT